MGNKEEIKQKCDTDPAFAASLKEAKTPEEVRKVLLAAGFRLTEEELNDMSKADCAVLSDEELDQVTGGFLFFVIYD